MMSAIQVWGTLEATHASYESCLKAVLAEVAAGRAEVLLGSHNEVRVEVLLGLHKSLDSII